MATRDTRPYSIFAPRPTWDIDNIAERWKTEVHQPFDADPGCCELCTRRWDQPYQHPCPRSDPPGPLLKGARDIPASAGGRMEGTDAPPVPAPLHPPGAGTQLHSTAGRHHPPVARTPVAGCPRSGPGWSSDRKPTTGPLGSGRDQRPHHCFQMVKKANDHRKDESHNLCVH